MRLILSVFERALNRLLAHLVLLRTMANNVKANPRPIDMFRASPKITQPARAAIAA
jgi:hypothetical protein